MPEDAQETSISTLLRSIVDRRQITDVIYRYCRSMDRMDAPLGYTVWHPRR